MKLLLLSAISTALVYLAQAATISNPTTLKIIDESRKYFTSRTGSKGALFVSSDSFYSFSIRGSVLKPFPLGYVHIFVFQTGNDMPVFDISAPLCSVLDTAPALTGCPNIMSDGDLISGKINLGQTQSNGDNEEIKDGHLEIDFLDKNMGSYLAATSEVKIKKA